MEDKKYIKAKQIMDKIDDIEQAIEYMETVHCSKECYEAIVQLLIHEQTCLYNQFHAL